MSGRIPKVVVVGGTYVDMAIKCGQVPTPGQSVSGSSLSYTVTGPGPNQAAEAALCGCEVYLISKVGGDTFAQMAKDSLAEFNVNTDFVFTAEAKRSSILIRNISRLCRLLPPPIFVEAMIPAVNKAPQTAIHDRFCIQFNFQYFFVRRI